MCHSEIKNCLSFLKMFSLLCISDSVLLNPIKLAAFGAVTGQCVNKSKQKERLVLLLFVDVSKFQLFMSEIRE